MSIYMELLLTYNSISFQSKTYVKIFLPLHISLSISICIYISISIPAFETIHLHFYILSLSLPLSLSLLNKIYNKNKMGKTTKC